MSTTDIERQVRDAYRQGRAESAATAVKELLNTAVTEIAPHMSGDARAALVDSVNAARFVTAAGDLDSAAVRAWVRAAIGTASTGGTRQAAATQQSPRSGSVAAGREAYRNRLKRSGVNR